MSDQNNPHNRGKIDRRSGWDRRQEKDNLTLIEMNTIQQLEEQCKLIGEWIKNTSGVQRIAFLVKEYSTEQSIFIGDEFSKELPKELDKFTPSFNDLKDKNNYKIILKYSNEKLDYYLNEEKENINELLIPLINRNEFFGLLFLGASPDIIRKEAGNQSSILKFIPVISSMIYNTIIEEHNAKIMRYLKLYQTVSSALGYIGDLHELVTTIIGILTNELSCESGSVMFYDSETHEFEFFAAGGDIGDKLTKFRFSADKGIAGKTLRNLKTVCINNVKKDSDFYNQIDKTYDFDTKSIIAAPLISGEEVVGIIEAVNKTSKEGFDKEDEVILASIAEEVSLAVKNARIFDFVVDSYCKIRQGINSCKGCKRPLKSWTPCAKHLNKI